MSAGGSTKLIRIRKRMCVCGRETESALSRLERKLGARRRPLEPAPTLAGAVSDRSL